MQPVEIGATPPVILPVENFLHPIAPGHPMPS